MPQLRLMPTQRASVNLCTTVDRVQQLTNHAHLKREPRYAVGGLSRRYYVSDGGLALSSRVSFVSHAATAARISSM